MSLVEHQSDTTVEERVRTEAGDKGCEYESELVPLTATSSAVGDEETTREVTWMQIVGGLVGNVLEWYDFAVFGYLAEPLAENFTRGSHFIRMISVYSLFACAFFARPFGGSFFGKLGDRIGRKNAVTLAMTMMFTCTFSMGCLPTYDDISVAAPLLLLLLRICQGFSAGGQVVGSFLIFLESASEDSRGFYASLVQIASGAGTLVGAATVEICKASMTENSLDEWGWRIPFLLSGVIGTVSLIPQILMEDSGEFGDALLSDELLEVPSFVAMRLYAKEIVVIALVLSVHGSGFYIDFIWLPNFISEHGYEHALAISVVCAFVSFAFIAVGGHVSDTRGWDGLLWKTALLNAFVAPPAFYVAGHWRNHWWALAVVQLSGGNLMALYTGAVELFMNDMVDSVTMRFTVMGVAYNVGICLFGGTAPLFAEGISQAAVVLVGVYQSLLCLMAVYILLYVVPPLFEARQSDKSRISDMRQIASESRSQMIESESRRSNSESSV